MTDQFSVLLIHTPYLSVYGRGKKSFGSNFPLGIAYLSAYLSKHGFQTYCIDPEAQSISNEQIIKKIEELKPNLVGISAVTYSFRNAINLAKTIKEHFPEIHIVSGGAHVSADYKNILQKVPWMDFLVHGEGEITLLELCRRLANSESVRGIKGLAWRNGGEIVIEESRPAILDMDLLPFPDRESLPLHLYRPNPQMSIGRFSASMITSRGCPYHCVFCSSHTTLGRRVRAHSAEYVLEEIEYVKKKHNVEHIAFKDDTIAVDKERLRKICNGMIERKLVMPWTANTTVSTVNYELLKLMRSAGCFCLLFGIESGDETVMKNMGKGITKDQCRKAVKYAKELGIRVICSFIFGLPGETRESAEKTIQFAIELSPHVAEFFMMIPYPGSAAYEMCHTNSEIPYEDFGHSLMEPVSLISGMTKDEMKTLVKSAYKRFYMRPSQLFQMAKNIRSLNELKVYWDGGMTILKGFKKNVR